MREQSAIPPRNGAVNTSTSAYVAYAYDGSTSTVDDPALGGDVTVADTGFRPTTLQYPASGTSDSRVITDSYGDSDSMNDEINQLDAIIDGTGTATDVSTGDTIDTVAHLGDGTLTAETYTLPSTTIGYNLLGATDGTPNLDQFNRVQNMVWANYGADTTLDSFEYLRNAQGDVTQRINAVDAVFSEMYTNDKLDQVESLTRGTISEGAIASPTFTESFSPDGFGNQSSYEQTVDGSTTVDQTSTFGPTNQVQDFSGDGWAAPSFDAAGNATATPNPLAPTTGLNVQVDGWNNVTHVSNTSDSIDVSYFYDALGNMIVRVNSAALSGEVSTTDIYYSGQQVLEEDPRLPTDPGGDATAVAHQYVYSPRSINTPIFDAQTSYTVVSGAWSTAATDTYYFLTDANNNVTSITNSSGGVVERYIYSAFGNVTMFDGAATPGGSGIDYSNPHTVSSVNNTILFAGMMIDPETGLYKDGARFYSSITCTFLTPDPALSDFDTYRYCLNDPTTLTDPTGLNLNTTDEEGWDNTPCSDGSDNSGYWDGGYPNNNNGSVIPQNLSPLAATPLGINAMLSNAAYGGNVALPTGWANLHTYTYDSGMSATLFYNGQTSKYILAFKGTTATSLKDWNANFTSSFSISAQVQDALPMVGIVKKDYKIDLRNLSLTGHSLGGGLAAMAGIETGLNTITFNAMAVPQVQYAIQPGCNWLPNKAYNNITSYYIPGDLLTSVYNKWNAAATPPYQFHRPGVQKTIGAPVGVTSPLELHLMSSILKSLGLPDQSNMPVIKN